VKPLRKTSACPARTRIPATSIRRRLNLERGNQDPWLVALLGVLPRLRVT
jgi:hypothetical protein